MPLLVIASRLIRTSLSVTEVGFLLQLSEMRVRRLIAAGELRVVGNRLTASGRKRCRIDPESAREHFPDDDSYQLRRIAMGAILAGRLRVPVPVHRWGAPARLTFVVDVLSRRGEVQAGCNN